MREPVKMHPAEDYLLTWAEAKALYEAEQKRQEEWLLNASEKELKNRASESVFDLVDSIIERNDEFLKEHPDAEEPLVRPWSNLDKLAETVYNILVERRASLLNERQKEER